MDGDDVDAAPQFYSPLKHQPAIKSIQPNLYGILQSLPTYVHVCSGLFGGDEPGDVPLTGPPPSPENCQPQ